MRTPTFVKCIGILALALCLQPVAWADEDDTSIGDGYEHSSNPLVSTVEASSTTAADVTLDASSEATTETTSGDQQHERSRPAATLKFATLFHQQLAKEFAQGRGERAVALATLLEVQRSDLESFFETVRQHYETIYPSQTVRPEVVIERLARLRPQ